MAGRKNDPPVRSFSKEMDPETEAMIYQGCSISQLARLFRMDNRTVAAKLYELPPAGRRGGYDYYTVFEAAPYLAEQRLDLDDIDKLAAYIKTLNHSNLPKMLTKEFWQAMLNRQKYEENAGDLWRTEKVMEVIGELYKGLQMPLRQARDTVANEVELTDRQQAILLEIVDDVMESMYAAVVSRLGGEPPADEAKADREEDEL